MNQMPLMKNNPSKDSKSRGNALIPILVSVTVPPVIIILMFQFVFWPKMDKKLDGGGHEGSHGDAHSSLGDDHGHGDGHGGGHGVSFHKSFDGIVTNLAGEHRTRFITVSYEIGGSDKKFEGAIDHSKAKIRAATMEYLSGLTLAQINDNPRMMELAGKQLKKKLNGVHGINGVIEELSFTEFSIQ